MGKHQPLTFMIGYPALFVFSEGGATMRFHYEYEHLNCDDCLDAEQSAGQYCPLEICPHIIDNLDDLNRDPAFHAAVACAGNCSTPHKPTLLMLRARQQPCPA